ncbi:ChrR family anti-sigma-E factor [Oricola cellulosilytica]|uniref:Transcriptional regulator n=1 Tax=Oricola cellulosilytica TaxID=1429082 RepID=A0A4V2MND3_9HYPH|nr:ChrR family anti-sigma-E factor [Oricola cellulosilytica]TCD12330.1 transcriptional regulator [Oricola cellulosilytica]
MVEHKFENLDALLARYAAGRLPKPVEVLVSSHLELSAPSRALLSGVESAAGEFLFSEIPAALASRETMLDTVFASSTQEARGSDTSRSQEAGCAILPKALQEFVGHTVDTIPWRTKMPGFREFELGDIDGCHVSMFWLKAGRPIPAHTHEGIELTLVLDGAFNDNRGRYGRGDISIADDAVSHRPIAEAGRACIGFAVTDGPLRLTGPLHQRISDIIGLG